MGRWREVFERGWVVVRWRFIAPLAAVLYRALVERTEWWRRFWPDRPARKPPAAGGRIAYYLSAFPVLSQTFVQREIEALLAAGVPLEIVAHVASDVEDLGDEAKALIARTRYLGASTGAVVAPYRRRFLSQRPMTFMRLFLAVVLCRYRMDKTFRSDQHTFRRALHLAGVLADSGVARLHAPWATSDAFVASIAARLLDVPHTVHARASDIYRREWACGLAARLAGAETVITNSHFNARLLATLLGARNGQIKQVYNGIDLRRFPSPNGARHAESGVRILCVARLIEAKGLEYLVRACHILKERGETVRCDIIGAAGNMDVNYPIRLRKLRRTLGLETEIQFVGPQPFERVLEAYQRSDVFALPSIVGPDGTGDVTPNVLIEAMAMQLPVISTSSRAIPEIVEDGVSGLLVPPADALALADALARVIHDHDLRVTLGANARKRVEERFDIRKNIGAFVALFDTAGPPPHR